MKILFIHQNFPGQYLHLARFLMNRNHSIIGLGESENIQNRGVIKGITTIGYPTPQNAGTATHHYLQSSEAAVRRGQAVARSLLEIKSKIAVPDVISLHPGWGEGLFVRDIFPNTPILMFCEYYFRAGEADLNFDSEIPHSPDRDFSIRIRNTPQLLSLLTASAKVCPTRWQASRYPDFLKENMHIIHDGVDSRFMCPDPLESFRIQPLLTPGESRVLSHPLPSVQSQNKTPRQDEQPRGPVLSLSRKDKVITYVARNFEPYRGTHVFLRALGEVQRLHPDAHALLVGSDGVSYSPALPEGESYKAKYLKEQKNTLDLSRIHFLGRVSYTALRALFRISSAHVYLTYPFVLSWSVLEAMACESLVIASRTAPVEEVMNHGQNGLLVDFFDRNGLVAALDAALREPDRFAGLRREARRSVEKHYHLETCLQKHTALLEELNLGAYPNPA